MRKSKFSLTQIAKILKEFDNGKSVAEITRDHGVSSAAFYKWRSKYADMSGNDHQPLFSLTCATGTMVISNCLFSLTSENPRGFSCGVLYF